MHAYGKREANRAKVIIFRQLGMENCKRTEREERTLLLKRVRCRTHRVFEAEGGRGRGRGGELKGRRDLWM